MLTVQQVADKLGLTPQGVYKKMNQQLVEELKPFIVDTKRGNRTVKKITPEGVEIIANSLEQPVDEQVNKPLNNDEQRLISLLEETIEVLREQLASKDEQLVVKDKQIERLGDMIEQSHKLNENNQVLIKNQQNVEKKVLVEDVTMSRWEKFKNVFK